MGQTRDNDRPSLRARPDAWQRFEKRLGQFLAQMDHPGDELLLELPTARTEAPARCALVRGDGSPTLRVALYANPDLDPATRFAVATMLADGDANRRHDDPITAERPIEDATGLAAQIIYCAQAMHGLAHPQLLTYRVDGPVAALAGVLGLQPSADIPPDVVSRDATAPQRPVATMPASRDELIDLVRDVLRGDLGTEPAVDDDGDFVLSHLGQPVWIRVRQDQPAVEIFARVAHDVPSRRRTAVEVGLLNRDRVWVRWVLRDRDVWQQLMIPGAPFAPAVLTAMLKVFLDAMGETRDDLALRLEANVA